MNKNNKIKTILLVIGLLAVLVADGVIGYEFYKQATKPKEVIPTVNVDESTDLLGIKADVTAPEMIVGEEENTLYVGNKDYSYGVVVYDNYGDVEVEYDDSEVNFDKAGDYNINIIATDTAGNKTEKTVTLTLKNKPVVYSNSSSGSSSTSSSSASSGSGSTALPQYDGMACDQVAYEIWGNIFGHGLVYTEDIYGSTDLVYGDLLYWPGHVAIYMGGGQMIEGNYDGQLHARQTAVRYDYSYIVRAKV